MKLDVKDKEIAKLKKENEQLRQRVELNAIDNYYISLIRDYTIEAAQQAVNKMLQNPIEMTHEQIEKAFGHKIKIISGKE